MSKTERILIAAMMFTMGLLCLSASANGSKVRAKVNALEGRLQNMEHLISLSLSESRSPVLIGRTNGVSAITNEVKQGNSPEIKRRAKRKSGHYPPAHDRRAKGQ